MSTRRPRVVVLDDDPEFTELMESVLGEEGFEFALPEPRPDLIEGILAARADLVMLDLRGVGDTGGLDLLRRTRDDPLFADLPVLVCSADVLQLRHHAAELAGLPHVGVLEKPFRIEALMGAIGHLLAGSSPFPPGGGQPDDAAVASLEERLSRVGRSLRWAVVDAWVPDRRPGLLRCAAAWAASIQLEPFAQLSRRTRLPVGAGLPGRIWVSRRAAWIEDLTGELNFPRLDAARRVRLVSAAAVTVEDGEQLAGVVAGYDTRLRPPDAAALDRLRRAVADAGPLLSAAAGLSATAG